VLLEVTKVDENTVDLVFGYSTAEVLNLEIEPDLEGNFVYLIANRIQHNVFFSETRRSQEILLWFFHLNSGAENTIRRVRNILHVDDLEVDSNFWISFAELQGVA
jgi:hypothetical protein